MGNDAAIRDLAKSFADSWVGIVEQKIPSASNEEIVSFCSRASSRMIANMLAQLQVNLGTKAAEKFLHDTLSLVSAGVRLAGVPVMPSFQVALHEAESLSTEEAPETPEAPPEAEPSSECACVLENGRCVKCVGILTEEYRAFSSGLFSRMTSAGREVEAFLMGTKACKGCFEMSDHAIANLVPKWIPELVGRPELAPIIAAGLLEVASLGGLTQAPMTKSELQILAERKA